MADGAKDVVLVHYSDAHIGSTTRGGGLIWKATGHDQGTLEAFSNALGKIRRQHADDRVLIHSGDASASGAPAQLDLYCTLRDVGMRFHGPSATGVVRLPAFRARFDHSIDIPGNHDLWNGFILNPFLNDKARDIYWSAPWSQRVPLDNFELVIHGICSTSGASKREQVCAVGAFRDDDLNQLEMRITRMKSRATLQQVHVVITHHSPSVGNGRMHGLASRSTAVFEQLCRRHEIAVLLTGHDHTFAITRRENLPVEVRASTATQRNRWPQKQIRQFWLHRIQDQGTVLDWKATSWIYDLRRFVEVGPLNQVYTKQISRL